MTPDALAAEWRSRASELRRYGAEPQAVTLEAAAAELDAALREAANEELTYTEAVAESGYSERRLREMIAEGLIPNAGRKGAPRIRRADLPRRVGKATATGYDPAADAARLLRR
jgi:hypothetical protein